jgi:hypothetical protein
MRLHIVTAYILLLLGLCCNKIAALRQTVFNGDSDTTARVEAIVKSDSYFRPVQAFVLPFTADGNLQRRGQIIELLTVDLSTVSERLNSLVRPIKKRIERVQWPWAGRYSSNERLAHLQSIEVDEVVPDVTDRDTIITLAEMTYNAYLEVDSPDWHNLGEQWNIVSNLS